MNDEKDYLYGMSEKDITDYKDAEKRIEEERIEQHYKDTQIIRDLKKKLPPKLFRNIVTELHDSENWSNLRIVNEPIGKKQNTNRGEVWVDQYVGICGDDFYGSCYFLLPDKTYLAWNYWM